MLETPARRAVSKERSASSTPWHPTQGGELPRAKALHPNGQAVDTGLQILHQAAAVHATGVGLQCHLRRGCHRHPCPDPREQTTHGLSGQETRRAPPDEDRLHLAPPDPAGLVLQITEHGRDISRFGEHTLKLVRVEIAVWAFTHAPRNMDVEGERWWTPLGRDRRRARNHVRTRHTTLGQEALFDPLTLIDPSPWPSPGGAEGGDL